MLKRLSAHCTSSKEHILQGLHLLKSIICDSDCVTEMSSNCMDSNRKKIDVKKFIARYECMSKKTNVRESTRGKFKMPALAREINGKTTKGNVCCKLSRPYSTRNVGCKGQITTNRVKKLKLSKNLLKRQPSQAIIGRKTLSKCSQEQCKKNRVKKVKPSKNLLKRQSSPATIDRKTLIICSQEQCKKSPIKQVNPCQKIEKKQELPEPVRRKSLRLSSQGKHERTEIYPAACYIQAHSDFQYKQLLRFLNSSKSYPLKRETRSNASANRKNTQKNK